jgi:hypothetical protein
MRMNLKKSDGQVKRCAKQRLRYGIQKMSKHNVDLDIQKMAQYVETVRFLLDKLEREIQQALVKKQTKEKRDGNNNNRDSSSCRCV